jgi:DnaJ-class molecular chaperone
LSSDFHDILGVKPGVTAEELRAAWRKRCRETHPDTGGNSEEFLRVMHAYRMLTDPSYVQEQKPVRSLDFQIQVAVSFEEAFFGASFLVGYNRVHIDENGLMVNKKEIDPMAIKVVIPQGSVNGLGVVEKDAGMQMGDKRGDAIINVVVNPHPRFHVRDGNVVSTERIKLETMLKGGRVEVQTMYGLRTLWVPPGTVPKSELSIPKCGVYKRGSHVVIVDPVFPSKDDLKTSAWKGLDIQWEKVQTENNEDDSLVVTHDRLRKK